MIKPLLQTALKIAASNKKYLKDLKFDQITKWASKNLLREKPLPRFTAQTSRKLIRQ